MSSLEPGGVLECCLHGKACRASVQKADGKSKREESEQYVNLAKSKGKKKMTRQEEAIERLARHLIHVEEHSKRRQRRREKRAKRRLQQEMEKERAIERRSKESFESLIQAEESAGDNQSSQISETTDVSSVLPKDRSASTSRTGCEDAVRDEFSCTEREMESEHKQMETNTETRSCQKGDMVCFRPNEGLAKGIYLGICNFSKAEEMVKKRVDFRLYHEMLQHPLLDELDPELYLFLVYKTANGSYRHYPVRTRTVNGSTYYYVDTGEKKPTHHVSLDHLVRYYQIHAQRHPVHHEYADPFPWWEVPI